ncbi:MAG: glycoside hydrolase family 43 protein, partial [Kutzneria sp.]|nr:glycoside hydrolase family 43 protein [Kutzneria sp.]
MAACSAALASPAAAAPHTDKIRTESAGTFRNPIKRDAADPWIQFYQGSYYMTETRADRITITKASSVADLAAAPETMVWQSTAPNRCCNLWAPELHLVDGRWYLYYTDVDEPVAAAWGVHPRDTSHHRMYVLQSAGTDPLGPYTFKGVLNTTIEAFAIDGTMFERPDGSLYFIWSGASDATSSAQNLYIAPMSNPWTISGSRVLLSEPTYDWERRPRPLAPASFAINEGPAVLQHDGRVFLTYSA